MLKRKLLYLFSFFLALFIWGGARVYAVSVPKLSITPNSATKGQEVTLTATNCVGTANFTLRRDATIVCVSGNCQPPPFATVDAVDGVATAKYTVDFDQKSRTFQVVCTDTSKGFTDNETDLAVLGNASGTVQAKDGSQFNTKASDMLHKETAECDAMGLHINPQLDQGSGTTDSSDAIMSTDLANVISTDDQVIASIDDFTKAGLSTDPNTQYSILISSGNATDHTVIPLKSLLGGIPVVGGLVPDITLPFSLHDDNSKSSFQTVNTNPDTYGGKTIFSVEPLHQEGTHYVKLMLNGQKDPICTFTQTVEVSNSVSNYICKVRGGSNVKKTACSIGAGKMCSDEKSVETAIGCVPTDPKGLVDGLLGFITRAAGGIALIVMALSSFSMITSQGNAEELKKAQERFRDAIIGLLFIILAVTILQIIGVDILQIPGLSR